MPINFEDLLVLPIEQDDILDHIPVFFEANPEPKQGKKGMMLLHYTPIEKVGAAEPDELQFVWDQMGNTGNFPFDCYARIALEHMDYINKWERPNVDGALRLSRDFLRNLNWTLSSHENYDVGSVAYVPEDDQYVFKFLFTSPEPTQKRRVCTYTLRAEDVVELYEDRYAFEYMFQYALYTILQDLAVTNALTKLDKDGAVEASELFSTKIDEKRIPTSVYKNKKLYELFIKQVAEQIKYHEADCI